LDTITGKSLRGAANFCCVLTGQSSSALRGTYAENMN
jgi:hypothetical protein